MARKKTYGQQPWKRFKGDQGPFESPVYNITDLHRYDGYLTVGLTSKRMIHTLSQFAFPQQVDAYRDWAAHNPQMDPRTWLPLAEGGVEPTTEEGKAISTADIASQVARGTYSVGPGVPVSGTATTPTAAPWLEKQPNMFASLPTGQQAASEDGPLTNFMNSVGSTIATGASTTIDSLQTAARAVQYGLMSGYDALQATNRTAAGLSEAQQRLASDMGLTEEEARIAFPITPAVAGLAGKDLQGGDNTSTPSTAGADKPVEGGFMYGLTHRGQYSAGSSPGDPTYDSLPDDRKALVDRARALWAEQDQAQPGNIVQSIADQTPAGAIARDPELLMKDKGWLAGNQDLYLRNEASSITAFDMRTADEVRRGVAPVGWTPGRGIAHNVASPDEQAFATISGVIDFGNSALLDPANAIPLGALGKVAKVGKRGLSLVPGLDHVGAIERGMATGGPKVGVQTVQKALKGARETARGKGALDSVQTSERLVDPDLLNAKGTKIDAETGLVTTPHGNVVMNQAAWQFLNSGRGTKMVDDLVAASSPSEIILRSNRKMDASIARQLADAKDAPTVRAILGTRLGMDLNDPSALRNFGSQAPALFKNGALRDNAVLQMLRKAPHAKPLDLENTDHAVQQLERFGRGAGMKWEDVRPHLDALIYANPNDSEGLYRVIYGQEGKGGFFGAVADHLATNGGIDPAYAHQITRAFKGGLDEEIRNFVNAGIADGSTAGGANLDNVGWAMLESEMFNRLAVLPDYRTIRSVSGAVGRISRTTKLPLEKAEAVTAVINEATTAWKSTVLLRPAYVAREVGEMSVAASLAGYDGLFVHPARFAALALSTVAQKEAATAAGKVAKALTLGEVPEVGRRLPYKALAVPVAGTRALADFLHLTHGMKTIFPALDHQQARVNGERMWHQMNVAQATGDPRDISPMYDGMAAIAGNFSIDEGLGRLATRQVDTANIDDLSKRNQYVNGLIWKLAQSNRDGDMRALSKGGFERAVADSQFSGRIEKKRVANERKYAQMSDEEILREHEQVLQALTGNDPDLIAAVGSGIFEGQALTKGNEALRDHIQKMIDDPERKAAMMPEMRYDRVETDRSVKAAFDKTMERFFEGTGEISDLLQRGPLIRQAYTKRVVELAPEMSREAKAAAVKRLRDAGDVRLARRIQETKVGNGVLTAEDVDHLAANFARSESRRIFYDAHERQNYALALRAVMPFAQATFNTIRRWGELSMKNPQLMYRTLKPLNYATQAGSASIYGALGSIYGAAGDLYDPASYGYSTADTRHNSVDGFFYTDSNGDRKFAYPIVGLLGGLIGAPEGVIPSSSLSGLNVAGTTIFPGFGPAITLPASFSPQLHQALASDGAVGSMARFVFPYGTPEGNAAEKVFGAFAPSWAAKAANAGDEQDTVANLAVKIMPTLIQDGGYDLSNSADQGRLWADSTELASRLYMWNAFWGSLTPSTINTKTMIRPSGPGGQFSSDNAEKMAQEILATDPNDTHGNYRRFVLQDRLKQDYDKYVRGANGIDAYRDGILHFVHDYGTTGLFAVLPSTKAATGQSAVQATNDVWHFRSTEPEAYRNNQDVIGYFFAQGGFTQPGDQGPLGFSLPMYQGQKQAGERVQKQQDFIDDAMREYGWMLWNPKAKEIDAMPLDEKGIAAAKDALAAQITELTGGAWARGMSSSVKTETVIKHMEDALEDDAVKSLNSAPYIATYLQKRRDVIEALRAKGSAANLSAKKNQAEVLPLITLAQQLIQQDGTGAFNNAWNRVFIDEFKGG